MKTKADGELDEGLPKKYDAALFTQKCAEVYEHIYEAYLDAGRSVYTRAA